MQFEPSAKKDKSQKILEEAHDKAKVALGDKPSQVPRTLPAQPELRLINLPTLESRTVSKTAYRFELKVAPYPGIELHPVLSRESRPQNPFATPMLDSESWTARQIKLGAIRSSAKHTRASKKCWLYECDVPVTNLSPFFQDFKILHLSDLHFKAASPRSIEEIAALAQYFKARPSPDLVVISGDIITSGAIDLDGFSLDVLRKLAPNAYCTFVLGNHDYYGKATARIESRLKRIGYTNITNRRLELSSGDERLNIYGIDDAIEGVPCLPSLKDSEHAEVNILVTHNLDLLQSDFSDSFDLVLSGHTHAGENFFGSLFHALPLRLLGLTQVRNGHFRGWHALTDRALSYISPGLGRRTPHFWTAKPGAALLTLKRA